ncbi:NAD(P)-dependent alcohol dehydrogenase [Amycolatopsis sp. NPDC004368]
MTRAAVRWSEAGTFSIEEVDLDRPRPDEVVVRLIAVGICHTDISASEGVIPFPLPGVLGHEGVGVVEEVGSAVRRASVGDRVLMTFSSCGTCRTCRGGAPAYCDKHNQLNLIGGRRLDGSATVSVRGQEINAHFFGQSSFAERALVDERSLVVLPPELADADLPPYAALACGVQTGAGAILNTFRPGPGDTVAITGAGAVGLSALMACRFAPTAEVIVVDRVASRLELALDLGATHVVDTSVSDLPTELNRICGSRGLDFVVETTGNIGLIQQLVTHLAPRGRLGIIGAPPAGAQAQFNVNFMIPGRGIEGITLGSSEPETFVPWLVDAVRSGTLPIERLTRTYPFEEIDKAVADAKSGATIKPILLF